ncbi:DegT/DnrJ/EryC1/StrS family aminotransferase [Patescibacteria group bacterium]|nr:DegT/DnrJ/EryC1/StrS family aminotransferase [Candidatus Falkowbacteria bacterium]MBU3906168.1 DegT/DnrJ/EryC1/StrS family aminotransferase [Patescibacteria group bacterium]MCG2697502.1 DegT/DnrJ/EryC1/StrS family aminotransferase [Candidatus Parcubacteria bacterium]MBU4014988.1 DegT/DnrJ/EryC1/StrS family aminotransferase [Patescibacteria group bacterium]MBU4026661.1 DegT/DnrJ/EryC1/StrS family aminotransferase [Patescibacteria group bacterium]
MRVPFFNYTRQLKSIEREINQAINKVLNSGRLILGDEVKNFENSFSKYIGVKYGIGVNSGTDAIKIALRALDVMPDDEVITVSNTAVPTISAIRELGAIPVFIDIKYDSTINESKIKKAITKKTKVILPVHLYGQGCNMPVILKIAKKHNLKIVEDCAQAHGTKINNKKTGAFGHISCFSFYPTKNLGAYGDAGIILTSNKKLAEKCRALRMYGMKQGYYSHFEGYNSRLDELQATILNVKLKHLDKNNKKRQKIATLYLNKVKNKKITLPDISNINEHVFHLFVIRTKNRAKLIKYLTAKNIGYGIHYPLPIHKQTAYKFLESSNLLNTESYAKEIISLPIFPELSKKEVNYIIKTLNSF